MEASANELHPKFSNYNRNAIYTYTILFDFRVDNFSTMAIFLVLFVHWISLGNV